MDKPIEILGLKSARRSAAVLGRLRKLIETGQFPLHSRLPPERVLAGQLGVGRSTLRDALGILEAEGRIWRHVGQGTFVGGSAPPTKLPPALDLGSVTPRELLEARLVLEPAIAGYAAATARPADVERMRHCALRRETASDPQAYNLWDHALHRAIAEATQNPILIALLERLNHLRSAPGWARYKRDRMHEPYRSASAQQHRDIIAAIAAHDPRAAFQAMQVHIGRIQESFYAWTETGPDDPPRS